MTSRPYRRALFAPETGDQVLVLVTIAHPALPPELSPLRVTTDAVPTTSQGRLFRTYPFELTLPEEREDGIGLAQLRITNVSREIVEGLELLDEPAEVTVEIVRAADPDTIEAGPLWFLLLDTETDALWIEGTLSDDLALDERWPADGMNPAQFPGAH